MGGDPSDPREGHKTIDTIWLWCVGVYLRRVWFAPCHLLSGKYEELDQQGWRRRPTTWMGDDWVGSNGVRVKVRPSLVSHIVEHLNSRVGKVVSGLCFS